MNYTKSAVFGSGAVFISFILANIIAYLVRVLLTKRLSVEDYGLFYAVFNFIILFLFLRDMGLNAVLVKFLPELRVKKKLNELKSVMFSVLSIQLITSLFLSLLFFLFAGFLSKNFFRNPQAEVLIKLLLVYVILSVFFRFIKSSLIGFNRFLEASSMEAMRNLFVLIFLFFFLGKGLNTLSPVFSYILAILFVILLWSFFFLRQYNPFSYKTENIGRVSKKVFLFGLPMLFAALGGQVIGYMDTIMLTYFTDLASVGVYNVILPSALLFLFLSTSISAVIIPLISELYAKKDDARISEGIRMIYKYSLAIVIPFILVAFSFPVFFLTLFFESRYAQGAFPFQILLVGVLFYLIGQINFSILVGTGRPKTVTKITLISAILNIIMNLILIPRFGITGAAIATSISYFSILVLSTLSVRKIIKIGSPFLKWALTMFSGVIYVLMIYFIKNILEMNIWAEIFISLSIPSLIYLGLLLIFRILDISEIKKYIKLLRQNSS